MNGVHRFRIAALIGLLGALAAAPGFAQVAEDKTMVIGLDLLGPLVGRYSGSFEHVLDDDISLFAIPTYYNAKASIFDPVPVDRTGIMGKDYDVWSVSLAAGANYFVNGVAPTGVFAGAWLSPGYAYARFTGSALNDASKPQQPVQTVLLGAGAHVGYRVLWGPVALTPRVGVSYQIAFSPITGYKMDSRTTQLKNVVANVDTGLRFPWSIEIGIAL